MDSDGLSRLLDAIVQLGIDRDVITWDIIPYYRSGEHWSTPVSIGTQWWGQVDTVYTDFWGDYSVTSVQG